MNNSRRQRKITIRSTIKVRTTSKTTNTKTIRTST